MADARRHAGPPLTPVGSAGQPIRGAPGEPAARVAAGQELRADGSDLRAASEPLPTAGGEPAAVRCPRRRGRPVARRIAADERLGVGGGCDHSSASSPASSGWPSSARRARDVGLDQPGSLLGRVVGSPGRRCAATLAAVAAAPRDGAAEPRACAASRRAQSWNVGQTGKALERQYASWWARPAAPAATSA